MGGIVLESTLNVKGNNIHRKRSFKRSLPWHFILIGIIIIITLIFVFSYRANHFNARIKVNGINLGGLNAKQALIKLKTSELKNIVYVGDQKILDGKNTKMNFTENDLPAIKKIVKNQRTFFPSSKEKNYSLLPSKRDEDQIDTMKKQIEDKLHTLNKSLKAPKDATVQLIQGKIIVSKSISGEQYDVDRLLKDYNGHEYTSIIRLKPVYKQPIKEDNQIVKNEKKKLQELLGRTVQYKVQDKVYSLNASEYIQNASVSKDMNVTIDSSNLKNKIAEINNSQSTLNKNFTFKTHSGSVISVKGEGYGWALDVDKESALVQQAFETGEKSITPTHIIGNGWNNEGYGYNTTTNNGIGDTYAEVSIAEQRIWLYKNGKLVITTNVVTGKHITGEDTSKGVWYILYKRTPSILRGSHVGLGSYEVKVDYWAPFTNSGQGFHDASWRSNWSSNAYLTAGSGGCVNTPPSLMKTVYDNLSTYEPVVIY
ncbi:L,D-transpeptidase family protein [Gottfriedia acidiceleris]|uniref:L,D-transpeptidase/peptidoglycan binding protein n=1 Tax=Gottfriedia acidiceleris TaxID=371036 RepID=A0ABY4JTB2_9BACI|nr:L,D-transpeptidase family protein [Gottfriedia acidiceleris]UPM55565.1 L,D-transpeptidase/peptidoglycan binding protein [Gottfriedia acidiceleris]